MKKLILPIICLAYCITAFAQKDSLGFRPQNSPARLGLQDPVEKGKPVTPLPDLMIIALDVKYLGMDNLGGKLVPAISITYSLKNNGQVAVAATDCNMQGFIGYDQRNPDLITGCGAVASQVKNVLIAPGAVLQGSIRCNVDFDRNRKPFYTLYADRGNTIRESNENNNTQQAGISGL